jgi:hypothetical protein
MAWLAAAHCVAVNMLNEKESIFTAKLLKALSFAHPFIHSYVFINLLCVVEGKPSPCFFTPLRKGEI